MKIFILVYIFTIITFCSLAEVTEDMKKRANEAGVIIERDHDPQRTYLANDVLAKDTIRNIQMAYYLHGKGVEPNVIEAYKWFILSEDETSIRNAKILSELMTKEELEKAENLIKNFTGSYQ